MYRQLLHTECKPGLRLSRGYEGTDAQNKVKHMPWWEQGVEKTKRMVISYDNLIVRLWLNGAIMPFVDGGYAEQHSEISVPKDDCNSINENQDQSLEGQEVKVKVPATDDIDQASKGENSENKHTTKPVVDNDGHIDTLIDSKGLPPIPHAYWVDRLGFQQTDPKTDFRSGGVLSLAMLVHIVEVCPNVHARFLPSGDAHMLPFGITCINVTDMIAKFCMFSKSVDKMDALLSQKPFWKMFENPDSLLVLQEVCMEILCNVVVEMGRERKIPKVDKENKNKDDRFQGNGSDVNAITVFDFAEILTRTEKRVNDDLLGSGPRTVDELRTIHTRNYTKYMRAIERKEYQAKKAVERNQSKGATSSIDQRFSQLASATVTATVATKNATKNMVASSSIDQRFSQLASATVTATVATKNATKNMVQPVKSVTGDVFGQAGNVAKNAGNIAGNVIGNAGNVAKNAGNVAGNVIGNAGGVFSKFKDFGLSPKPDKRKNKSPAKNEVEEIDFAKPQATVVAIPKKLAAAPINPLEEAQDLLDFLDDDDVDTKTEKAKQEFADLLGDAGSNKTDAEDYFTIDDDDFL